MELYWAFGFMAINNKQLELKMGSLVGIGYLVCLHIRYMSYYLSITITNITRVINFDIMPDKYCIDKIYAYIIYFQKRNYNNCYNNDL